MKKPAASCAPPLVALYPELARNPDKLAMWVENGSVRATKKRPARLCLGIPADRCGRGFHRRARRPVLHRGRLAAPPASPM